MDRIEVAEVLALLGVARSDTPDIARTALRMMLDETRPNTDTDTDTQETPPC